MLLFFIMKIIVIRGKTPRITLSFIHASVESVDSVEIPLDNLII